MRKYFENRLIQCVLILVILCGAILFSIREHWQSPPEVSSGQVSKTPIAQQTPPAVAPAPQSVPPGAQPAVAKRYPVAGVPGIVPASQRPSRLPPAAAVTQPQMSLADKVKAEVERLTEGMDAFTAAKRLNELEPGRGGHYGPYIRAFAAQAYSENPDDVEVVEFWAYLQPLPPWQGSNPEAIVAYRKLLEMRPDSPDARLGLSRALWTTEPEEALGHLKKVIQVLPGYSKAVELQANAYQRMGAYDTALAVLKAYREKYPMREPVELSPQLGYIGGPTEIDFQIQAIESGKPLVEPHPRYLEAPRGEEGGEGVPTAPFEQQTVPTGGLPEDATLESLDGTLPPQTSPAETPQTPAGRTDAEWKHFLDNMTTEQASAFAQFLRAEFPELSKFLDAPVDTTSAEDGASQTPAISAPSGAFSPERLRNAQALLKRYGPTEGLRRLRNQDPALAKQVARSLTHRKRITEEQDSPPSED